MQKVFRLLRHNLETGPFTIGELLQQQLHPADLIWVDGESTAWAHPQEMENLKYALSETEPLKKEAPKKIISQPISEDAPTVEPLKQPAIVTTAGEIERKAEELRQRSLSFKGTPDYQPTTWTQQPLAPILPLAESDIEFVVHKRPGLPVGETLMGAMVVSLLVLGWYGGGKNLFQQPKEIASAVAVRLEATEENAAIGAVNKAALPDTTASLNTVAVAIPDSSLPIAIKTIPKKTVSLSRDTDKVVKQTPALAVQTDPAPAEKTEEKVAKQTLTVPEASEKIAAETAMAAPKEQPAAVEPEEKKRGLGKVFKGLFRKKKKDDDKPAEEVKPADK